VRPSHWKGFRWLSLQPCICSSKGDLTTQRECAKQAKSDPIVVSTVVHPDVLFQPNPVEVITVSPMPAASSTSHLDAAALRQLAAHALDGADELDQLDTRQAPNDEGPPPCELRWRAFCSRHALARGSLVNHSDIPYVTITFGAHA
jgi:hypothetical protein